MKFKKYYLLCVLFLITIHLGSLQIIKRCNRNEKCINAESCPSIQRLLEKRSRENAKTFRDAICSYQRRKVLVCCPPKPPPNASPSSKLLPKQCGRPIILDKIFGGVPAPVGAYPWLAALGYLSPGQNNYEFDCGGSVINSKYVLTAAHCVHKSHLGRRRLAIIYIGVRDLSSAEDCARTSRGTECFRHLVAGFEHVVIHPQFDQRQSSSDDIALIRLNVTLDFENPKVLVEPVCLPSNDFLVNAFISRSNRKAVAAGWGLTEHNNRSNIVLSTRVPIVNIQQCIDLFGSQFVGKQLCAGGEQGFDSCLGDSGGPLVVPDRSQPPFTQIGIVSFGTKPCGIVGFPSVYTSVADYTQWIIDNLKP